MMAPARLLLGPLALALAAAAVPQTDDAGALFQHELRVSSPDIPAGALNSRFKSNMIDAWKKKDAPSGPIMPPLPAELLKFLNASLPARSKSGHREEDPAGADAHDGMNLADLTSFLQVLFDAVRSEDFMGNMTKLMKDFEQMAKNASAEGTARLNTFMEAAAANASTAEVITLAITFFNSASTATTKYAMTAAGIVNGTLASMPADLREKIRPGLKLLVGSLHAGPEPIAPGADHEEFCAASLVRIGNVSRDLVACAKAKHIVNTTQGMLPMMQEYLESAAPSTGARIMYIVNGALNTGYLVADLAERALEAIIEKVRPLLAHQVGCSVFSAGLRWSPGALAMLVSVAAAWLTK